jgi:Holliday junction resolvase RusA-like endonuclease
MSPTPSYAARRAHIPGERGEATDAGVENSGACAAPYTSALRFIVPGKPLSVNELYTRTRLGDVRKSDDAKAYAEKVSLLGRAARMRARLETITAPVEVTLRIFFQDERPDTDGPVKLLLDALQSPRASRDCRSRRGGAAIIRDDRQVRRLVVEREIDKKNPRVEVTVQRHPASSAPYPFDTPASGVE